MGTDEVPTLLLKVFQFAALKHPAAEPEAAEQVRLEVAAPITLNAVFEKTRGEEDVKVDVAAFCIAPVPAP